MKCEVSAPMSERERGREKIDKGERERRERKEREEKMGRE